MNGMNRLMVGIVMAGVASFIGPQSKAEDRTPLTGLFGCLEKLDLEKRAECLESEARRLQAAERSQSVVIMNRAQVAALRSKNASQKGLKNEDRSPFVSIDTRLTGVRQAGGKWLFATDGHGSWVQAESVELPRNPRVGDRFRVRRGAIGSFLANINDGMAIRVNRAR